LLRLSYQRWSPLRCLGLALWKVCLDWREIAKLGILLSWTIL
jgi:hypothetical protein